ncbi:phage tail protein [Chromohalobacter sp.]|uniref:phage tail protein n=1 Tax=Chromohalobacter sp. TaxID=50740 RepID=UPI003242692E
MVDADTQFGGFLTQLGIAKRDNAVARGTEWEITDMVVGDGGGEVPTPDTSQEALIHEVYRASLNALYKDPVNPGVLIAELVMPPDTGGWWVRELGLLDADGDLVAIANCAPSYKPLLQQGSGRDQTVRMRVITSAIEQVKLRIDPTVVLASRQYVDSAIDEHAQSRDHPDATTTQRGFVKKATRDATRQRSSTASVVTPGGLDGAMADHENASAAHRASQITLDKALDVFGDADTVQAVLALLGAAAKAANHNDIDGRDSSDAHPMSAISGLNAALEALDQAIGTKPNRDQVVRADKASQIDVGRGVVMIENHDQDNADGAGLTFRTTDNPGDGSPENVGAILAIRSSGDALRLWVGQSVTSTGDNDFETRNLKAFGTISGNGSGLNGVNADTVDGWHRDRIRQWGNITGKPATATRWPRWSEVSGKPDLTQNTGSGQVGTYGMFVARGGATTPGHTTSGSALRWSNCAGNRNNGRAPSGTWRLMGSLAEGDRDAESSNSTAIYLRIA